MFLKDKKFVKDWIEKYLFYYLIKLKCYSENYINYYVFWKGKLYL